MTKTAATPFWAIKVRASITGASGGKEQISCPFRFKIEAIVSNVGSMKEGWTSEPVRRSLF
jgi:hypothetical protein